MSEPAEEAGRDSPHCMQNRKAGETVEEHRGHCMAETPLLRRRFWSF
jgi:hypothetical protein